MIASSLWIIPFDHIRVHARPLKARDTSGSSAAAPFAATTPTRSRARRSIRVGIDPYSTRMNGLGCRRARAAREDRAAVTAPREDRRDRAVTAPRRRDEAHSSALAWAHAMPLATCRRRRRRRRHKSHCAVIMGRRTWRATMRQTPLRTPVGYCARAPAFLSDAQPSAISPHAGARVDARALTRLCPGVSESGSLSA
jgi:hypothetical protein